MAEQVAELERIDKEKGVLLAERDENNAKMSSDTKRTGQTLMTVENLYSKIQEFNILMPSVVVKQREPLARFDNQQDEQEVKKGYSKPKVPVSEVVAEHLQVVVKQLENFHMLEKKFHEELQKPK